MAAPRPNPTTIRLSRADRQLLARLAQHKRMPRSEVVREAIRRMARQSRLPLQDIQQSA